MGTKTKSAEILCIGTELLMGDIVNTNAAYIARRLAELGINLYHQSVVGDNPGRLRDSLEIAFSRADIVITTGGLGPTYDDLSKETVAAFFGRKLVLHAESLEWLESYFTRLGRPMTENNRKQAMMPEDCTVFPNPNGTAPGCAIEQDGRIAILLPGPPREMQPMMDHAVIPFLQRFQEYRLVSHNLHFFGIGESTLEEKLRALMTSSINPTVAPYAKTGEVMLRVTARVQDPAEADAIMAPALAEIDKAAGEFLYGVDVGDLQTALCRALKEKGLHVALAESCTGGMTAARLTGVPGASQVFECGICCYSNAMKEQLAGVRPGTLAQYGAVSEETARELAAGARRAGGAQIGVGITGNAGPEPSEGKPVGLVYVAVDSGWYQETITLNIARRDDDARAYIRTLASSNALNLALRACRAYPG
ncbi:MAG: competence/damage-inducible protein A [Provencibacterium sp.]|jgi:nicotinamide-nucleotide amidase|nr:competence/damage-inducible protein A [Provencibacterium sp.]